MGAATESVAPLDLALEFCMFNRILTIFGVPGIALAVSACASFPPPNDAVAASQASVRGAEELGAANVPQAALQLQLAQEQVRKAKQLMADGKNELAHWMALRAGNDAELAIALTREDTARGQAGQAEQRVDDARTPETTP